MPVQLMQGGLQIGTTGSLHKKSREQHGGQQRSATSCSTSVSSSPKHISIAEHLALPNFLHAQCHIHIAISHLQMAESRNFWHFARHAIFQRCRASQTSYLWIGLQQRLSHHQPSPLIVRSFSAHCPLFLRYGFVTPPFWLRYTSVSPRPQVRCSLDQTPSPERRKSGQ